MDIGGNQHVAVAAAVASLGSQSEPGRQINQLQSTHVVVRNKSDRAVVVGEAGPSAFQPRRTREAVTFAAGDFAVELLAVVVCCWPASGLE